jgi:hypothetical protein
MGYSFELQTDGAFGSIDTDTRFINTQFGLYDGVEFGIDFDISRQPRNSAVLNAKVVLYSGKRIPVTIATGISNVAHNGDESPYVVSSYDLKSFRLHGGAIRISNKEWGF